MILYNGLGKTDVGRTLLREKIMAAGERRAEQGDLN